MSRRGYSTLIKSFRSKDGRRRYQETTSDSVPLDLSQDSSQLLKDIFLSLCNKKGVTTGRNLGHLNNLIKILCHFDDITSQYSLEEILVCLKPALVSDVKEVRAACIRALRYIINDSDSVNLLTKLHLDCLIIKCLDISHFNEVERIQCLRLIRKILHIAKLEKNSSVNKKSIIPQSFVSCIIAISCDGAEERDRVYRTCLAVLCELVVLEPALVIESGGLLVLLRAILECHMYRRINESLCMSLALLLNHPLSRNLLNLEFNFNPIFAPYTDVMYRLHVDIEESQIREEQEMRFLASKMAIVSILHTWSGLVHLGQSSALHSFLCTLSIPNSTTKRATLSVLYEIFCFNEPKWTDDFSEAFESIGPKLFQESWRLTNLFAAGEGKFFLSCKCNPRPDLINCYMAILLSIFLRDQFIEQLVDVVLSTDSHASVSACILLGAVLHLCSRLLPNANTGEEVKDSEKRSNAEHERKNDGTRSMRDCLPELMKKATSSTCPREEKLRAGVAICRLQEVHNFFNKPAAPSSVYLNELLFRVKTCKMIGNKSKKYTSSQTVEKSLSFPGIHNEVANEQYTEAAASPVMKRNRSITIVRDFSDEQLLTKIKETQVLVMKDHANWKWDVISSLLVESWSRNTSAARSLRFVGSDDTVQRFIKRLVNFFLPSSGMFSKMDQAREGFIDQNRPCIQAGCHLMRFLATADEEGIKILNTCTDDIVQYLSKLIKDADGPTKAGNLFSTTCTREYFLLLGAMTMQKRGNDVLKQNKTFDFFFKLANEKTHETLIKLIVSSLFYTNESLSYLFLKKVLVSCKEPARLYATSYLRVLLRAEIPEFITWGIGLLITQLYDQSNSVASEALDILNEACDDSKYLQAVVELRPSVLHLGEPGALMVCRFMSHPTGFKYLMANKYLKRELHRWWDSANERYVTRIEELFNLSLTCFERPNQQGGFVRRSGIKKKISPVPLPSHIYGELCRHEEGCKVLEEEEVVPRLMKKLKEELRSHEKIFRDSENSVVDFSSYKAISEYLVKIKSCLWALAHIGSSSQGLSLLRPYGVVPILAKLAQSSPVHSICGTCFYCLSVISQTVSGTEELRILGWLSVSKKARRTSDSVSVSSPVFKSSSWSVNDARSKSESFQSWPRSFSLRPEETPSGLLPSTLPSRGNKKERNASESAISEFQMESSMKDFPSVFDKSIDRMNVDDGRKSAFSAPEQVVLRDARNFNNSARNDPDKSTPQFVPESTSEKQSPTSKHKGTEFSKGGKKAIQRFDSNPDIKEDEKFSHPCSKSTPDLSDGNIWEEIKVQNGNIESFKRRTWCGSYPSYYDGELHAQTNSFDDILKYTLPDCQSGKTSKDIEDVWCFNKLMGLSAIGNIREQQCRRKLSIIDYALHEDRLDNWSTSIITDDIRGEIEQSMYFVGIALPENLDQLFKHKSHEVTSPVQSVALIPARIRHKNYSSKQSNPFAAFSSEEPYSCASVRSDTTSFLEEVASSSENSAEIIHQQIIKLVMNLGSSVGVKMNETALLVMKEKFPNVFDSASLYYNLSDMLAEYNFRITTRRFIQELFHDVALTEVYQEARRVLEQHNNYTSA